MEFFESMDSKMSEEERKHLYEDIIPFIKELVFKTPKLFPEDVSMLLPQIGTFIDSVILLKNLS
jgi:hypothetical protein